MFSTALGVRRRTTFILPAFAALLLAAAALLIAPSAEAKPYPPTQCSLSASSARIQAGGTVTLVGTGFDADTTVTITLASSGAALGTAVTDANGTFSITVDVPSDAPSGENTVIASGGSTTCSAHGTSSSGVEGVGVGSGSGTPGSGSSSGSGTLAETGVKIATISLIGLALIGGGAMLLTAGRRRHNS